MVTKNLVVLLLILYSALSAHVKIGDYDSTTKTWRGYNPACDDQCTSQKGEVCGTNVRTCCTKDQCQPKLGFPICKTPLALFNCDQGLKKRKLDDYLTQNGIKPAK